MTIQTIKFATREIDVFICPSQGKLKRNTWRATAAYTIGRGASAKEALHNWEKEFFSNQR